MNCGKWHKAGHVHKTVLECETSRALSSFWLQSWISTPVLIIMVTLSFFCKPVLSPECLVCLFLMPKAELRNIWTRAHSQMDTAWVIVPRIARCVPGLTEFCECVCVYFRLMQDDWWGFPVCIAQLNIPMVTVWPAQLASLLLKTLCLFHMEQLRSATRSHFFF